MTLAAMLAPQARRDLLAAAHWIAKENPSAAVALRDAVVAAVARIGKHPWIGALRPELAPQSIRFLVVSGFPCVIVYDADQEPPLILRVLHGARELPELLRDL
jgi:plasmid stabilization system protein ParE